MNFDHEPLSSPEFDIPTPEQLEQFEARIRQLVAQAKNPYRIESSVGVRFYNRHESISVIGIGRGVILFEEDAVDLYIRRVTQPVDENGYWVERHEEYAYVPGSGQTHFAEEIVSYCHGRKLRSAEQQRGLDLMAADWDEAFRLVAERGALDETDSDLADYIREVKLQGARDSEFNVLTRQRLEVALEELSSLSPSDEELTNGDAERLLRALFPEQD